MGVVFITVWLVGGAFVPEGPSKKLAPMLPHHFFCFTFFTIIMMMPLLWYYYVKNNISAFKKVSRKVVLMRQTFLAYLISQLHPVGWTDSTSWKCLHIIIEEPKNTNSEMLCSNILK